MRRARLAPGGIAEVVDQEAHVPGHGARVAQADQETCAPPTRPRARSASGSSSAGGAGSHRAGSTATPMPAATIWHIASKLRTWMRIFRLRPSAFGLGLQALGQRGALGQADEVVVDGLLEAHASGGAPVDGPAARRGPGGPRGSSSAAGRAPACGRRRCRSRRGRPAPPAPLSPLSSSSSSMRMPGLAVDEGRDVRRQELRHRRRVGPQAHDADEAAGVVEGEFDA